MPNRGKQLFTRSTTALPVTSPPSPTSSTHPHDDLPTRPELVRMSTGVMSLLNYKNYPKTKTLPGESESPTPPQTPINEVPCSIQRSKSAPVPFHRKVGKPIEKPYDEMSEERRKAARSRIRDMILSLQSSPLEDEIIQSIRIAASESVKKTTFQESESEQVRAQTLNSHRRYEHGKCSPNLVRFNRLTENPTPYEDFPMLSLNLITNPNATIPPGKRPVICEICSGNFPHDSLDPRESAAWRVHGCGKGEGHFVHTNCLNVAVWTWGEPYPALACKRCDGFKRLVTGMNPDIFERMVARMESSLIR